ncbi:hypothetical protein [Streptomyces canus]|uniref:hypothetical protein n=1 Tax=Streptomyces canus TaxID=58343 RepID=UPI0036EA5A90
MSVDGGEDGGPLIDAALTPTFDETGPLLIAFAWLTGLTVAAAVLFRRTATTPR